MTNFDETKTVDAETLWNTPIPPVHWVIPDLLPDGLALLAGASKAGKSWLCLWLCLQVARGGQVWGRQVSPQPVLYLCLEDTFKPHPEPPAADRWRGRQPQPAVPDPQWRHRAGAGSRDHRGAESPSRHRAGGHRHTAKSAQRRAFRQRLCRRLPGHGAHSSSWPTPITSAFCWSTICASRARRTPLRRSPVSTGLMGAGRHDSGCCSASG